MLKTIPRKHNRPSKTLTSSSQRWQNIISLFSVIDPHLVPREKYNLTISEELQFLWFRNAKVCTRTIFDTFERNSVVLDCDHPMSVQYIPALYSTYYKFCFVRNPWDRLVSCWLNKVVQENYFGLNERELQQMQAFENFVSFVSHLDTSTCDHHIRLQSKLIDTENCDFIGRYERFNEDFSVVMKRIGLAETTVKHLNASASRDHYTNYYTNKLQHVVGDIYEADIVKFNYCF